MTCGFKDMVLTLLLSDLLEVTLVNAQGQHVTLNDYTDPDYFYAVRGGGGNSWGVGIIELPPFVP